jgi:hypothetical protein
MSSPSIAARNTATRPRFSSENKKDEVGLLQRQAKVQARAVLLLGVAAMDGPPPRRLPPPSSIVLIHQALERP